MTHPIVYSAISYVMQLGNCVTCIEGLFCNIAPGQIFLQEATFCSTFKSVEHHFFSNLSICQLVCIVFVLKYWYSYICIYMPYNITCHISTALTVSVDVQSNTIIEGDSTSLEVSYTGILHPQSAVTVIITTTPGSASGQL